MRELTYRTVVVGSGCAGLNAADTLASLGEKSLLLVTEDMNAGTSRNTGSDKQTYYKLSLSGDEGDSIGALARDLCGPDVNGDTALCEAAASAPSFFKLCALIFLNSKIQRRKSVCGATVRCRWCVPIKPITSQKTAP